MHRLGRVARPFFASSAQLCQIRPLLCVGGLGPPVSRGSKSIYRPKTSWFGASSQPWRSHAQALLVQISQIPDTVLPTEDPVRKSAVTWALGLSQLGDGTPNAEDGMQSLLALSQALAEGEHYDEAVSFLDKAIELHNAFSSTSHPSKWLAEALGTRSLIRRDSEDDHGAAESAAESVAIWAKLAEKDPARYNPYLGAALMNLGCRYADVEEDELAGQAFSQSIALARDQTRSISPLQTFNTVGQALIELSAVQWKTDQELALKSLEEAVGIARAALDDSNLDFTATVIDTLASLIRRRLSTGDEAAALNAANEQCELYTRLKELQADVEDAAEALAESGKVLLEHGLFDHVLKVGDLLKSSVTLSNELAAEASFLRAAYFTERGRLDEALQENQDCIQRYQHNDPVLTQQLACAYNERGRILFLLGRYPESLETCRQAISVLRAAITSSDAPSLVKSDLGRYLVELGQRQLMVGQLDQALGSINEAIEISRATLDILSSHASLADAQLIQLRIYAAQENHDAVIKAAGELQIILESLLEGHDHSVETFDKLVETVDLMIPSLEALGPEEDLAEAKQLLEVLNSVRRKAESEAVATEGSLPTSAQPL